VEARSLEETIEMGRDVLADVLEEFPDLSDEEIDAIIKDIAEDLTPKDAASLIKIMLLNHRLFFRKVDGVSALDLIYKCMIEILTQRLAKEVFIE
jgi:hypothetical protein